MQFKQDTIREKLHKSRKRILTFVLAGVMLSDVSLPAYAGQALPQEQAAVVGNATGYADLDFELPEDQAERENEIAAFSLEAEEADAVSENELPAAGRL